MLAAAAAASIIVAPLFLWFVELAVILFKLKEKSCRKRLPNNNKNYIVPSDRIFQWSL